MFPIERDKIVRSSLVANLFHWKLMTSSNVNDTKRSTCMTKINRLKRRRRQIWKWFLLNSFSTFSGALSGPSAKNFWILIQIEHFWIGNIALSNKKTVGIRHFVVRPELKIWIINYAQLEVQTLNVHHTILFSSQVLWNVAGGFRTENFSIGAFFSNRIKTRTSCISIVSVKTVR